AMLMRILQDRGSAACDRIAAAELAGGFSIMSDLVADRLLSILQSTGEPEQLRAWAAISLGPALEGADTEGFDDELAKPPISEPMFKRIQAMLQEIHADHSVPKEVRRRVLEASVPAPRDWQQAAIREAYSSSDE